MPQDILQNKKVIQPEGGWTKHAPAGGVTINGKFFSGGVFIPNDDMENASDEEKKELLERQELIKKYGAKNVKKMLDTGQIPKTSAEGGTESSSLEERGKHISENVYIIDDGTILGDGPYGEFIIKKGDLRSEDLLLLNAFKTRRIDCIIDSKKIISYKNAGGTWSKNNKPDTEELDRSNYDILNNLSEPIKDYFFSSSKGSSSTTTPPLRMSLMSQNLDYLWKVEHEGKEKLLFIDKPEDVLLWCALNDYLKHTKPFSKGKKKKVDNEGVIDDEIPQAYNEVTSFPNPAEVLLKEVLMGGDGNPKNFRTDGTEIYKIKLELPHDASVNLKSLDLSRFVFPPFLGVTKKDIKKAMEGFEISRKDLERILNDINYPNKDLFLDRFMERFYNIGKYLE